MKAKLKKLRSSCIALSVATGITLTGCSSKIDNENTFNTADYSIVYVNKKPHLVKGSRDWGAELCGELVENYYDVNSNKMVGKISPQYELAEGKNVTFSNKTGAYLTRFAFIRLNELVDKNHLSNETYQFFTGDSKNIDSYLDDNYLYDVNFRQKYEDDVYITKLGIYDFTDDLSGENTYHIGYNASRSHKCEYIYDIKDNKVYKKPDIGSFTFQPIEDLYEGDSITANDAMELMNNYIKEKESGKTYRK